MQMRTLFFGKTAQSWVIHRGYKHQCGVGFDPGLSEFLFDARRVFANIGSKGPDRADLLLAHEYIIARLGIRVCLRAKTCLRDNEHHVSSATNAVPAWSCVQKVPSLTSASGIALKT